MLKRTKTKFRNFFNIAFTALWIFGLICIFGLIYTHNSIQNSELFISKALDLKKLNNDANVMISSDFKIIDLSVLNEKMLEIDVILKDIDNMGLNNKLSYKESNIAMLELKNALNAKKVIISKFITDKVKATEQLLDVSSTLRYATDIRQISNFYTSIILSRFGNTFDAAAFDRDVSSFRYQLLARPEKTNIDFNMILKLISLNDKYMQMDASFERISQLNVPYKVDKLIRVINEDIAYINAIERGILGVLAFLIISFLLRLIYEDRLIKILNMKNAQIEHTLEHSNNRIITIDMNSIITKIKDEIEDDIIDENISFVQKERIDPVGTKFEVYDSDGQPIDIISDLRDGNLKEKDYKNTYRADVNRGEIHEHLFTSTLYDKFGNMIGANIIARDFTKVFFMQNMLDNASADRKKSLHTDAQTGIANHLALNSDLDKFQNAYLLYIGIDQFENIQFFYNDKTVDIILKEISSAIMLCMSSYKFKGEVYHIQDDRFGIIYVGQMPKKLANTLLDYFSSTVSILDDKRQEIKLDLNLHIGISLNSDTESTERLIQARLAFQKAKKLDENVFAYEQNDENEIAYRQNQIVSRMIRNALNDNKVTVDCQPIFDLTKPLKDGGYELFSYEVLVRILDEEGKMHYPGEFLNIAKQAGLYLSITRAVINIAFELVEIYDNRFSINLASSDMLNKGVKELFVSKLETCTKPRNITIEVLESEDVEGSIDGVLAFLDMVRKAGCHVAIDDFGSGYANIAMILQLDIDYIKIDGSIIQRLPYDKDSREFLRMLANFTKSLNYTMVAEFVSSQEILDQVKELGVQYAQGYLLGKPTRLL